MKTSIVQFLGGTYQDQDDRKISYQLSENCYPANIEEEGTYTNQKIKSIEGNTSAASFPISGTVGCRGLYTSTTGPDGTPQLYAAYEKSIYRIKNNYSYIKLGDVGANSSIIKFSESGGVDSNLALVDGYNLFVCPLSADDDNVSLSLVPLPNIPGTLNKIQPTQIVWINGRLIVNSSNSDQFFYTAPFNVSTSAFNDLSFNTAEGSADKINALGSAGGNLWIFGLTSFEVYQSTSDVNFPFSRITNAQSNVGCLAPESVVTIEDNIVWLGSGKNGYNQIFAGSSNGSYTKISRPDIEEAISKYSTTVDAIGQTWTKNGHTFYSITFPTGKRTYVYDFTTKQWHNRSTKPLNSNNVDIWELNYATFAYGKIFFGNINNSYLVYLDDNKYDDYNSRPIIKKRISPVYIDSYNNVSLVDFALEVSTGLTRTYQGQGANPKIMMRVSTDGGFTWSSERTQSLGQVGQYSVRPRWLNCGFGRFIVIEVSVSDPVPVTFIAAKCRFVGTNTF